ncbi:TlyA family RNA methyltransferase [Arthrobacter sp. 179]|uniref:TlyA family RNA methyltransferase n=1 Tax=Arthrobacter sp. 179 TaxID=3457734 RepID=UPI004033BDE1
MSRLDQELVARGLARSRTHAAQLIADSRVSVDGQKVTRAAKAVAEAQDLAVSEAEGEEYVSRAGHKLAGALGVFTDVLVRGRRCLDAGASTGGFTEVLLRNGAGQVVSVDVGHDQLVRQIRDDPRVDVHEGMNIRGVTREMIGGPVDLVVADLSFISLRLVVGPLAGVTRPGGDLVLMVKPQFEVGRDNLGRTGVVTSAELRRRSVEGVVQAAREAGLSLAGLARSPLPGQDGNVEFFLRLSRVATEDLPQPDAETPALPEVDYS